MSDDGIDWNQHARDAKSFQGWPGLGDTDTFGRLPFTGKVLDMGSNICRWYKAFQWLNTLNGHKIEYFAFDGSSQVEQIVRELYPEVNFTSGDIYDLASKYQPEFFNVVYSAAFLQHFSNSNKKRILEQVRSILKHGGYLIITESFFSEGDPTYTNDRVFTVPGWHRFMAENGFTPFAVNLPYIVYQYPEIRNPCDPK